MSIAYVSSANEFKEAVKTADEIVITTNITLSSYVLGNIVKITSQNNAVLTLDNCEIVGNAIFKNMNVVFADTLDVSGVTVTFDNCIITCSKTTPIANVPSAIFTQSGNIVSGLGLTFNNCKITTSATELFEITPKLYSEIGHKVTPYGIRVYGGSLIDTALSLFVEIPEDCDGFTFSWESPITLTTAKEIGTAGWVTCSSMNCDISLSSVTYPGGNLVLLDAIEPSNMTRYRYGHIYITNCNVTAGTTARAVVCSGNFICDRGYVNGYSIRVDGLAAAKQMVYVCVEVNDSSIQRVIDLIPITNACVAISPTSPTVSGFSFKSASFAEFELVANLKVTDYLYLENTEIAIRTGVTLKIEKKAFLKVDAFSSIVGAGTLLLNTTSKTLPLIGNFSSYDDIGPYMGTTGSSNSPDGFNNAVVQKMIDKYGDRVFQIMFDNHSQVLIGYTASTTAKVSDIVLEKVEGVDLIGFRSYQRHPQDKNKWISYMTWHATGLIQYISIMDEACADHRPDLLTLT